MTDMNSVLLKQKQRYQECPLEEVELTWFEYNSVYVKYMGNTRPIVFEIRFNDDFPFHPPRITMKQPLWHPNVKRGRLLCDLFHDQWSPGLMLDKVILSIVSLILTPDPICSNLATQFYLKKPQQYHDIVQYETTQKNQKWLPKWITFLLKYFPLPEDVSYTIATMITYPHAKSVYLCYNNSLRKRKKTEIDSNAVTVENEELV